MKVNVGCGKWDFGRGWEHIDIEKDAHIKGSNYLLTDYEHNSVSVIYSSHFLGYLEPAEAMTALGRWNLVLKKGGKLQLAVPDFNVLANLYSEGIFDIERVRGPLLGRLINRSNRPIEHKEIYDIVSLSRILHCTGFDNIKQIHTGFYPQFKDQSWAYFPDRNYEDGALISLNVECEKI